MDSVVKKDKSVLDMLKEDSEEFSLSKDYTELRADLDQRLFELKQNILPNLPIWKEICDYMMPQKGKYINATLTTRDGGPVEDFHILNNTAQDALETLASGMLSGISSFDKKWFNFSASVDVQDTYEVKKWLNEVSDKMFFALQRSNFYQSSQVVYNDSALIGTAPTIIYEDPGEKLFNCVNLNPGEFFLETNDVGEVVTLFREFSLTTYQMVKKFGIDNVPELIRVNYKEKKNLSTNYTIYHCMQPSEDYDKYGKPKGTYIEVYWSSACQKNEILQLRSYEERPFFAPRWFSYGTEAYGIGCSLKVLGAVKQLQILQKSVLDVVERYSNPALQVPNDLIDEPTTFEPGGIVYVDPDSKIEVKPIYATNGDTSNLRLEIEKLENSINSAFFKDLWLMLHQLQGIQPRTTREIDERRAEKLSILSPSLQRLQTEYLDPAMERIFKIMYRRGAFSQPPKELLDGDKIKIVYTSFLYTLQNVQGSIPTESFIQMVMMAANANPEVLDKVDWDYYVDSSANTLSIDPRMLKDPKLVQQNRTMRQQANQQQQQMQMAMQGVQGIKELSQVQSPENSPLMNAIGGLL